MQVEKIIPKAGQPEYKFYLFSHVDFDIKYNGENVIEVNVITDPQAAVDISENTRNVQASITAAVPTQNCTSQRLALPYCTSLLLLANCPCLCLLLYPDCPYTLTASR